MIQLGLSCGTACILAYGQTGSGKTYTMEGLETRIARDLFVVADHLAARLSDSDSDAGAEGGEEEGKKEGKKIDLEEGKTEQNLKTGNETAKKATHHDVFQFSVTFLELLGKRAVDLLEPDAGLPLDDGGSPVRSEVLIHEDKVGAALLCRSLSLAGAALNRLSRTATSAPASSRASCSPRRSCKR